MLNASLIENRAFSVVAPVEWNSLSREIVLLFIVGVWQALIICAWLLMDHDFIEHLPLLGPLS